MIFLIETDLIQAREKNFLMCFRNLLLGYAEGYHLLYIKPKDAIQISEIYSNQMDEYSLRIFNYYQENSMLEMKEVFNCVDYAIQIIPMSKNENRVQINNHNINFLHAQNFLELANIQPTSLVAENILDADIYKIIANKYIEEKNSKLKLQVNIEHGGGNTISDVFGRKVLDNLHLCIAILDSDKKCNNSCKGDTAKRFISFFNKQNSLKVAYKIIGSCRELENLLPLKFYDMQYSKDCNKTSIVSQIISLSELDENYFLYFDLKNGISYFEIINNDLWSKLIDEGIVDKNERTCFNNPCKIKRECKFKPLKGFGNQILNDFISFYERTNEVEFYEQINTSIKSIRKSWAEVGKFIFSWCCGQEKILPN